MSLTPPSSKPFLQVFEEQPSYESSSPPPIWLMRQQVAICRNIKQPGRRPGFSRSLLHAGAC